MSITDTLTEAMREPFGDLGIEPSTYRDLIATMPGPDPDDLVISAAALAAGVAALLTWTPRASRSNPRGTWLRVTDPDTYLSKLAGEFVGDVAQSSTELALRADGHQ